MLQQVTFTAYPNSNKEKVEIIKVWEKPQIAVIAAETFETHRVPIVIPPLPPSDEEGSRVCKVRYNLRVSKN